MCMMCFKLKGYCLPQWLYQGCCYGYQRKHASTCAVVSQQLQVQIIKNKSREREELTFSVDLQQVRPLQCL